MSGPSCLVFETSTLLASLALVAGDGCIVQRDFTSDRSHNAALFGPLEELLALPAAAEIGLVLVGSGPGSYSGTRVGIAAAQGVAIARGCPAVAVPSILAVPSARTRPACLAVGDARRGSYWTARIAAGGLVDSPAITDNHGLASAIQSAEGPVFAFESAARWQIPDARREAIGVEHPDASRLWEAWLAAPAATRAAWQAEPPQPIYLKPPHITPGKPLAERLNAPSARG